LIKRRLLYPRWRTSEQTFPIVSFVPDLKRDIAAPRDWLPTVYEWGLCETPKCCKL
jgi:hypothetical protein